MRACSLKRDYITTRDLSCGLIWLGVERSRCEETSPERMSDVDVRWQVEEEKD